MKSLSLADLTIVDLEVFRALWRVEESTVESLSATTVFNVQTVRKSLSRLSNVGLAEQQMNCPVVRIRKVILDER